MFSLISAPGLTAAGRAVRVLNPDKGAELSAANHVLEVIPGILIIYIHRLGGLPVTTQNYFQQLFGALLPG